MGQRIRVMLVDDHAIVLEGYRRLLEKQQRIEVVAEATDSAAAYQLFKNERPDVVVTDISMPGRGGIDLIGMLRQFDSSVRVVVFSMHQSPAFALHAFQAGARAYITKSSKPLLLVQAIIEVFEGRSYISPDVSQTCALVSGVNDEPHASLSPREFEILRLVLDAKTAPEIASALNLSPKTVANYQSMIKQKLGVSSDIELLYLAISKRLVAPPLPLE
jgi:DNA-binding NarL/FixJ family response regulator